MTAEPRYSERYYELAKGIASRAAHVWQIDPDEALSDAMWGLVVAERDFDPDKFGSFPIYARLRIWETIRHGHRSRWIKYHLRSRKAWNACVSVRKAEARLTQLLGRTPTIAELATATGFSELLIADTRSARVGSLEVMITRCERNSRNPSGMLIAMDLLKDLEVREQQALIMTAMDFSQTEIASVLGCSQMHVSRILRRAREQLNPA